MVKIMSFIKSTLNKVHQTTAKTFKAMVGAAMKCKQIGVSSIGRAMEGCAEEKHKIKRSARFVANEKIKLVEFYRPLAQMIIGSAKSVCLAFDWSKINRIDGYNILSANIVIGSRSLPILIRTYEHIKGKTDMTAEEISMIDEIAQIIPVGIEVTIIMDRGFLKRELLQHIDSKGFHYIVRSKCNNYFCQQNTWRKLSEINPKKNYRQDFGQVLLHKNSKYGCRLVVASQNGNNSPSECWYLFTNILKEDYNKIIDLYARRMEVEETFRDIKDKKCGFQFRGLKLKTPDRYDRILLVFAYAYAILTMIGIWAESHNIDRSISSNTSKKRTIALWRLGYYCLIYYGIKYSQLQYGLNVIQLVS